MDVLWYLAPVTIAWLAYSGHHMWRAHRATDPAVEMTHLQLAIGASVILATVNIVIVLLIHVVRAVQ